MFSCRYLDDILRAIIKSNDRTALTPHVKRKLPQVKADGYKNTALQETRQDEVNIQTLLSTLGVSVGVFYSR